MQLPVNTLLRGGTYRIIRFISSGGFGCTYEAEHVMLEKRVAIKEFFVKDFCNRDETTARITVGTISKKGLVDKLRRKFIDEARALCKLQHPGIVSVSDVFEENGTAYYVMDYIDGKSLSDIVHQNGPLPEDRAVQYICQVATALQYVHDNNRLHLDIKPGNIMIDSDDNPILIDFGASKQYDEVDGENTSTLLGKTAGYAPLEQMSNSVVKFLPATDIYALGATLYKLLTGVTPPDSLLRGSGEELEPLPQSISASTRNAVMAALQMNKTARPQSLAAFLKLLQGRPTTSVDDEKTELNNNMASATAKVIDQQSPKLTPKQNPTPKPKPKPQPKPNQSFWERYIGVVVGVAVVIGAFIGFMLFQNRHIDPTPIDSVDSLRQIAIADSLALRHAQLAEQQERKRIVDMFKMVYVAGGTFTMGASASDSEALEDEKPAHSVTLSGYYIGKYEVTQKQWVEIMGSNPSEFKGDNLPVERVSWNNIQEFIRKLNAKTGKKYRLPTEAEWEFAARGGNRSRGYKYSGGNLADEVAWYGGNSGGKPHPVGTKSPNELGIYDMTGNIYEWCSSRYGCGYYSNSPSSNPKGPSSGDSRVLRGGSWSYDTRGCRVSSRFSNLPSDRFSDYGFRLALSL